MLVKGPNVFQGYWNRPDLQADTFDKDGWFKTGDVFKLDDKGNFYITDRIKELIKYSTSSPTSIYETQTNSNVTEGFQVPPAELEAKLHGHDKIADCCVVGVWNKEEHTEVPRAYVVPTMGSQPSDDLAGEIILWLNERVAPPKKLRGGVRFLDAIPKSQSGKILRRILKEQAKKEDEAPKAKL